MKNALIVLGVSSLSIAAIQLYKTKTGKAEAISDVYIFGLFGIGFLFGACFDK